MSTNTRSTDGTNRRQNDDLGGEGATTIDPDAADACSALGCRRDPVAVIILGDGRERPVCEPCARQEGVEVVSHD